VRANFLFLLLVGFQCSEGDYLLYLFFFILFEETSFDSALDSSSSSG